jgi:hypothetical protein
LHADRQLPLLGERMDRAAIEELFDYGGYASAEIAAEMID